jgi:hypothetical protein
MSRSCVFLLSAVLLVNPVFLGAKQKATQDFNTFLATFKTAVEHKDTETLASLMSPSFDFIRATNVPPRAVFSGLDSNHGQQWLNLQQAVQGTPVPYAGSGPYKDSRVLRCTPIEVSSNCLVIFNKDSQNRWRWRAMVMPTLHAPIYSNPFFFLGMERRVARIRVLAVGTKGRDNDLTFRLGETLS